MNFLEEIPLPAAFGIPDGGGVGGFADQQVRAAFINPGSSEQREFKPKSKSGDGFWHRKQEKREFWGSFSSFKLIQLKIEVTDLEKEYLSSVLPVLHALKCSPE